MFEGVYTNCMLLGALMFNVLGYVLILMLGVSALSILRGRMHLAGYLAGGRRKWPERMPRERWRGAIPFYGTFYLYEQLWTGWAYVVYLLCVLMILLLPSYCFIYGIVLAVIAIGIKLSFYMRLATEMGIYENMDRVLYSVGLMIPVCRGCIWWTITDVLRERQAMGMCVPPELRCDDCVDTTDEIRFGFFDDECNEVTDIYTTDERTVDAGEEYTEDVIDDGDEVVHLCDEIIKQVNDGKPEGQEPEEVEIGDIPEADDVPEAEDGAVEEIDIDEPAQEQEDEDEVA